MNINDTIAYQNIGLPDDILRRKLHGDFPGAIRLIDRRLAEGNLPQAMIHSLQFHREMILRLPEDFPYSKEEALAIANLSSDIEYSRRIYAIVEGEETVCTRFFADKEKSNG